MAATIWEDCVDAIVTAIQGLGLDTFNSNEVVARDGPFTDGECQRGISVCPTTQSFAYGVMGANETVYGIQVTWVRGRNYENSTQIMKDWMAIVNKFHQKRLSGVLSATICMVTPVAVMIPKKYRKDYNASAILIRVWTRDFAARS